MTHGDESKKNRVTPAPGDFPGAGGATAGTGERASAEGRLQFLLCHTLACLMGRDLRSCFECELFPCDKLKSGA